MSNGQQVIKYMLIGSNMVGKTAFLSRFSDNNFNDKYEESKGVDFKSKLYDSGKYKLCIFDTPGDVNLRFASYGFYKFAFGFILIFDLTRPQTLQNLRADFSQIASQSSQYAQLILVGNKSDLSDLNDYRETQADAQRMADELHISYFEISCLTGQNFDLVIEDLTQRVLIQIGQGNLGKRPGNQTDNIQKDENIKHEGGCCCKIF
ncbi:unnamed protein product (macronuclear) [Paramecium tetraurelia]|uniref:Uncharacterized protein n=1 Tax=Paramecium tetraurelia TaxID=5888 RepID=A0CRA6_PARTE|nr:uncharacterized protein GSPATT00009638001 [Paramecium tetraurelia]CAK73323.1 unnamed protein product [Paramecium tetraurelia]|eukprot:XP_001440720.1 hypothetical protein (macronuclear) [Paramecium tetraurelia strain d4-2]